MKVACLVSGGKDSILALHRASIDNEIICLVTALSENPDSYMFHTPGVNLVKFQADSMNKPLITFGTKGVKEAELTDLRDCLKSVKEEFNVQGIVSGAVESVYQKRRIDNLCRDLGLQSIAPLWKANPLLMLKQIALKFKAIIISVSAEGFNESWLGRQIDEKCVNDLVELNKKHGIHLMGEGGEYESAVLKAPLFSYEIPVEYKKVWKGNSGHLIFK